MPVTCQLCNRKLEYISSRHLKYKHDNMTVKEYREMFPDAPIMSAKAAQRRTNPEPIKYTITCPNCGAEKIFEKACPSSYENKFCNRSCATTYYDKKRWADPKMREKIIIGIVEALAQPEYKERMRLYWTQDKRQEASERSKEQWRDPDYREKVTCNLSQLAQERWADPDFKTKMLEILGSEDFREGASKRALERWADPEYYDNTVDSMKDAALERWADPDFYEKMCFIIQERWTDPIWAEQQVQKMMAGQRTLPTKPELELFDLLISEGYEYVYTGDRGLFIGNKNPDFIWPERKLIVECFGAYWHNEDEAEPRIDYFTNYGFNTLIIWDYELKDTEQLLTKLEEFHQG